MLKYYLALALGGLPAALYAQCAPPLSIQEPLITTNTTVPIEQYLSRAISLDGMHYQWWEGYRYGSNGSPESDTAKAEMDMAVQLRAAFLIRAAGNWGNEDVYNYPVYLAGLANFVQDINQRYDCAGVRRPLIQAAVFTEEVSDAVELVTIKSRVIKEFEPEMTAAQHAYYFDGNGQPLTTLKYAFSEVGSNPDQNHRTPTVHQLQGRMWIYQQACYYLDAGFTSLHMGQTNLYSGVCSAGPDVDRACQANRAAYQAKVAKVMRRIRRYYAAIRQQPAAHLILTSEPGADWDGNNIKFALTQSGATDSLLFDCNLAAARPRETSPQLDNRRFSCAFADDAAQSFDGTNLANAGLLLATIDPCHGYGMLPDGGGVTPAGYRFSNKSATPYSIYLDFWSGRPQSSYAYDPGEFTPGAIGTWGYDDSRWFSFGLPASARGVWTAVQLKRVRKFIDSESFLQVTGRANGDSDRPLRNGGKITISKYHLAVDNPARQQIATAWTVLNPQPQWEETSGGTYTGRTCSTANKGTAGKVLPTDPGGQQRRYRVRMYVQQPDVTSIYTWHIRRPDGNWESMVYGEERYYQPTMTGTYYFELKQDNLGLDAGATSRTVVYYYNSTLPTYCENSSDSQRVAKQNATPAELLQQPELEVFPQPNAGQATIQLTCPGPLAVSGTVEDVLGRQVLTVTPKQYENAGAHNLEIDLHAQPAGVYTCQLLLNGTRRAVKLMKQ